MNNGLKDINEIITVCESLEQFILIYGPVETGDANYEKYKELIDRFDHSHCLQTHSSKILPVEWTFEFARIPNTGQ